MSTTKRRGIVMVLLAIAALGGGPLAARQGGAAPASDPLSGDWNAVAFYDTEVLFSLSLKVEGTIVTGTVSTGEGSTDLRNGKWENGTFSFETDYQAGPVVLSATVSDGKLVGTWSYNGGEASGRWEATRKTKA